MSRYRVRTQLHESATQDRRNPHAEADADLSKQRTQGRGPMVPVSAEGESHSLAMEQREAGLTDDFPQHLSNTWESARKSRTVNARPWLGDRVYAQQKQKSMTFSPNSMWISHLPCAGTYFCYGAGAQTSRNHKEREQFSIAKGDSLSLFSLSVRKV